MQFRVQHTKPRCPVGFVTFDALPKHGDSSSI